MDLQPHQQRVVDEKADLDGKIAKLDAFVDDSPIFKDLPPEEQLRLTRQRYHMSEYSDILSERIEAFTVPPS